jgi:cation diffusion facilitator family transporter
MKMMSEEKVSVKPPIVRIGVYSLTVNLILTAAKLSLSFVTGSLALRADGVHSLVDIFASIALILGLVISGRKSRNFPYGLYKVENLVSAIISLLLFFTAYEIVIEAISGRTSAGSYSSWVLAVVAIFVLFPFFFGRYELNAGKRYNSPSLIADGSQFRADVLGSSIVFIGLLGQLFGFPLDRIAAGIVALFIVYAAWGLLVNSMRVLLDASVSYEILDKVRSLILAEPTVSTVQNLAGRNSGRFIFVEATITVRTTDLKKAHLISEKIEQAIKSAVPNVDRVLIHCEPETKTQLRYAVTLSNPEGQISEDFGKSSYFALVEIDSKQKRVIRQEIVANPYRDVEKGRGKGIKIAEFLLTYKPDVVIARENLAGKGPGYALDNAGTEIRQTEAKSLDELLSQLIGGQSEK